MLPVLEAEVPGMYDEADLNEGFLVNPTGKFVIGGPVGDAGLTGRKIIVDTYGGMARHGGGAFSGKDPSKVDRSAAYAARYVAKNVVAAGLAERCEVQVAYAIGVAHPVSLMVETFGTGKLPDSRISQIVEAEFDMRPGAFRKYLDLHRPIFQKTAAYGHFGREDADFTWEKHRPRRRPPRRRRPRGRSRLASLQRLSSPWGENFTRIQTLCPLWRGQSSGYAESSGTGSWLGGSTGSSRARICSDLGFSPKAIRHRLASGRLRPVARGVYTVGWPLTDRKQGWMAAVLVCGEGARAQSRERCCSLGDRSGRRGSGRRQHSPSPRRLASGDKGQGATRACSERDVTERHGIPVTTPVRTMIDRATELTPNRARADG